MSKVASASTAPMSLFKAALLLLHPIPSLLTVVVAGAFVLLAARGFPPASRFAQLLLVEAAMQFSISAFNDYFDRSADAGRSDKPVACGIISPRIAWITGLLFGIAAVLLAFPLGLGVGIFTVIGLCGGLLYDAGLKSTVFSWLPFSIAFPTLPLWAWAGALLDGSVPLRLYWVVPVGGILVLGIHLADTIPDLAGDTEAGIRGLAHRIGLQRSLALCWAAFTAATLLTLLLWPFLQYNAPLYLSSLLLGVLLMGAGILLYLHNPGQVRRMSLLLEVGAMLLAIGWVAGLML